MRRMLLPVALLFMCATPLYAQTHYCDTAQPTSGTAIAGAPLTLSVCADNKDASGSATTVTGWALYDNGVRTTPTLVKGTTSTTSGKTVWDLTTTAPSAASVHTYQAAAINAQGEGTKTSPFVLTVSLPPTVPSAPTNLSIR